MYYHWFIECGSLETLVPLAAICKWQELEFMNANSNSLLQEQSSCLMSATDMSIRQPIRRPNITVNCSVHGVAVLHKLHNLGANQGPRCPHLLVYNSTSNSSTGRDGTPGHRLQLKFSQSHSSGLKRNQSTKNSHWAQEFMSHNGHIPKTLTLKISSNQIWVVGYFGQPLTYPNFNIFSSHFLCNSLKS
jgi:hypothetical protein